MLALYTFLAFSNASNCPWAYGVTECFIQDAEISVGRTPIDEVPYFGNQHWVLSQNWFSNASSFRTKMRIRDNRIEKPELSHIFPICFPICFHSFSHMFPYFPRNFPYFSLTSSRAEAAMRVFYQSIWICTEALTAKMRMQFEVEDLEVASQLGWQNLWKNPAGYPPYVKIAIEHGHWNSGFTH